MIHFSVIQFRFHVDCTGRNSLCTQPKCLTFQTLKCTHKGPKLVRKSTSDVSLFRSSNTDRGPILIRAFTSYRAGCFGSIWLNCCSEQNAISNYYVIVHPLDFHIVYKRTGSQKWILREQALQSILSSGGAFGWNTLSDRTNSPNSITPFCFLSKRSNTCRTKAETTTIN